MSTTATTERLSLISIPHPGRRAKRARQSLTREQFVANIKASQARFERGEFKDDVWALEEEMRAYAKKLQHSGRDFSRIFY